VSGHHSLIINILNDSFLEDLNSTNGTYVNGKLIKKHALQHGDVVTVGHHQLRFVEDDEAQDEFEKTMVIQPSSRPAVDKMRAAKTSSRSSPPTCRPAAPARASTASCRSRKPSCRCCQGRSRAASSS
jgi:pSer/pThr/pTyr-binding forkhead associated (FHA) protein